MHNRRRVVTQRYRKKQHGGTVDPEQVRNDLQDMLGRLKDTDLRHRWHPEKHAIYKIKAAEKYCQQVPLDQCEMTHTKRGFPCSVETPSFFRKRYCTFSLPKALQKLGHPVFEENFWPTVNTDVTWHESETDLFSRHQIENFESYP